MIFITPPLQHYFWKRQRHAELQLKAADELNDIAATFYTIHSTSVAYKLEQPFLTHILSVRGKVKALFSDEASKRFEAMHTLIAATGSESRGLGAAGKVGAYEIIERAAEAVQTLYREAIGSCRGGMWSWVDKRGR
jgi:hypothetical protein